MCPAPAAQTTSTTNGKHNWVELALGGTDANAYVASGTNVNALQHTLCVDAQMIDRRYITRGGPVT
jgi:hypothetical protein